MEQEKSAASSFPAPPSGADGAATGIDLDLHGLAAGSDGRFHGQLVDIHLQGFFLLPAAAVEPLPEVALAIKQADADERNAQVRGALDMIGGENSQAAGVDGNRFMQSELSGEIGHRAGAQDAGVVGSPGAVCRHVVLLSVVGRIAAAIQPESAGMAVTLL